MTRFLSLFWCLYFGLGVYFRDDAAASVAIGGLVGIPLAEWVHVWLDKWERKHA